MDLTQSSDRTLLCRANMGTKGLFSSSCAPLLLYKTPNHLRRSCRDYYWFAVELIWIHPEVPPAARTIRYGKRKTAPTHTCSHLVNKKLSQMGLWFQRNTFSRLWKVWHSPTQFTSTTAPCDTELKDWEVKMEKNSEILESEKRRADVLTFKTTKRDTNETSSW